MGYLPREVVPLAVRSASGDSGQIVVGGQRKAEVDQVSLLVNVTAVTGTSPTLDLTVEWSPDGQVWAAAETPDDFAQITSATTVVKRFDTHMLYYRIVWTIGGTSPEFTFQVFEDAHAG